MKICENISSDKHFPFAFINEYVVNNPRTITNHDIVNWNLWSSWTFMQNFCTILQRKFWEATQRFGCRTTVTWCCMACSTTRTSLNRNFHGTGRQLRTETWICIRKLDRWGNKLCFYCPFTLSPLVVQIAYSLISRLTRINFLLKRFMRNHFYYFSFAANFSGTISSGVP